MRMWVIMSTFNSPIAICIPSPVAVFQSKKQAKKFCDEHNANPRTSTEYYMRSAEYKEDE